MHQSCDTPEDCLADPNLTVEQRTLLAAAIRYQRIHTTRIENQIMQVNETLENHINEQRGMSQRVLYLSQAMWGDENDPDRSKEGLIGLRNQICRIAKWAGVAIGAIIGMMAATLNFVWELVKVIV